MPESNLPVSRTRSGGRIVRHYATSALLATAAVATTLVVGAPAASAIPNCDNGEHYRVTAHRYSFVQVGPGVALKNPHNYKEWLTVKVGQKHVSSVDYSGSISASVSGGFWKFAKAQASVTAGIRIYQSVTMFATYGATVPVPPHSSVTVRFGFRRYNQYIQRYHGTWSPAKKRCVPFVDHAGWVHAPNKVTFLT